MHEKLIIASCLCVIAAGLHRKRFLRRKLKCGKKRRLDSDALSDNEVEQPSQSHNTQDEDETSDIVDSDSEHISTEEENSDNESLDDSESDDFQRKVSETLDQALKLLKRETEKEDDVCHSFARLIEYELRNLPKANRSYVMYEIKNIFYKHAMQALDAERDNLVVELQPTEESPHSTSSFPELEEATGGE